MCELNTIFGTSFDSDWTKKFKKCMKHKENLYTNQCTDAKMFRICLKIIQWWYQGSKYELLKQDESCVVILWRNTGRGTSFSLSDFISWNLSHLKMWSKYIVWKNL